MLKPIHFAFALSLLLSLAHDAAFAASFASPSFRGGFSASRAMPRSMPAPSAARAIRPAAPSPAPASRGFGAFGRGVAQPQQPGSPSGSALTQKLDRQASQARALRTLDERRAAQAAPAAQPAPSQPAGNVAPAPAAAPGYAHGPAPAPAQAPIVIRQDSGGLGHVVVGAMLANAAANSHAHRSDGYAAPASANTGSATTPQSQAQPGGSVLGSLLRLVLWLAFLALLGWGLYVAWQRLRLRRAADKPNYSFERD